MSWTDWRFYCKEKDTKYMFYKNIKKLIRNSSSSPPPPSSLAALGCSHVRLSGVFGLFKSFIFNTVNLHKSMSSPVSV